LLLAMALIVAGTTALVLYFARQRIAADEQELFAREFRNALGALQQTREVRHGALLERSRALARKPRIQAALEDGALDLLYLNAVDELRDIIAPPDFEPSATGYALRARFHRFLDHEGQVISPADGEPADPLPPEVEAQLALPRVDGAPQIGYVATTGPAGPVVELVCTPVFSSDTGEVIAALVLGFPPTPLDVPADNGLIDAGIYLHGRLLSSHLTAVEKRLIEQEVAALLSSGAEGGQAVLPTGSTRFALFYQRLNPGSLYPPAYEVCLFPLTEMLSRQRALTWQILGTGAVILLLGLSTSHFLSGRLSRPVDAWVHETEEQRLERARAEAALESTHAELQRTARFSADASHQLKTPITVLRAGLENLLAQADLNPTHCTEVSALIHQTFRLSSIIEDLLLLSRIDAGQLQIRFGAVDLRALIEASLDDLSALADDHPMEVETELPARLEIAGERRYVSLILQNLLENARKYNAPHGRIRVTGRVANQQVYLSIANTSARPIPIESQTHIFERFHRAGMGENVAGYGLGLNLARELARIHGGDLRLVRSDSAWTELEVRFRAHFGGPSATSAPAAADPAVPAS
jgi:signal transduction histidine kinase